MFKKFNRQVAAIGAAYTTGLFLGANKALAQNAKFNKEAQDADTFLNALLDNFNSVPAFITTLMYIVGILLAIAGIYKLKEAVDNPGQNSVQDGFIRLAAGGALIALPSLVAAMGGTLFAGGEKFTSGDLGFGNDPLDAIT